MNYIEDNKVFVVGLNKLGKQLTDMYYFLDLAQQRRSEAQEVCSSILKLIKVNEND